MTDSGSDIKKPPEKSISNDFLTAAGGDFELIAYARVFFCFAFFLFVSILLLFIALLGMPHVQRNEIKQKEITYFS